MDGMEHYLNKFLALGIVFLLLAVPFVVAKATYPSVKPYGNKPNIANQEDGKIIPSSTPNKGCITKWGWNGQQWLKRDLKTIHGKIINGEYCTAFSMARRKIAEKPSWQPIGSYHTDKPLNADWFRHRFRW
jgi:hypothetical protein